MKIILLFAASLNGYIAEADHSVDWPAEVWQAYSKISKEIGNMIVGRRTYELMQESGELTTLELRNLIVVSSKFDNTSHHVAHSPEQAIAYLAALGEKEVLICGGASIATHLLQRGLLNEIIIDTVSTLISGGIPMFGVFDQKSQLRLLTTEKLSLDTVRLHYRVDGVQERPISS